MVQTEQLVDFDKIIERSGTGSIKYDRRKEIFGRDDVIPMWVADMDFETPGFILDALKQRLEHPVLGYTLRKKSFFEAFMDWAKQRYGLDLEACWLTFSPGVVAALAMSVLAYTEPGDKVLIQPPIYPPFFTTVKELGRQLVESPLIKLPDGKYVMDYEDLERQFAAGVKLILISNPHNPVGRVWTEEELRRLGDLAYKYGVKIVSDDIHADFVYSGFKYTPLIALDEKYKEITVTAMAPSKTFNIAGLSTSIVIIPDEKLRKAYNNKLHGMHLFLGNIFGNIAFELAYKYGGQWLDQLLVYLEQNVDLAVDFIQNNIPNISVWRPEGTFLLWLDFSKTGLTHQQIQQKLIDEAKLGFNDGMTFGKQGEYHFRMNIAAPRAVVEEALYRLKKVFS